MRVASLSLRFVAGLFVFFALLPTLVSGASRVAGEEPAYLVLTINEGNKQTEVLQLNSELEVLGPKLPLGRAYNWALFPGILAVRAEAAGSDAGYQIQFFDPRSLSAKSKPVPICGIPGNFAATDNLLFSSAGDSLFATCWTYEKIGADTVNVFWIHSLDVRQLSANSTPSLSRDFPASMKVPWTQFSEGRVIGLAKDAKHFYFVDRNELLFVRIGEEKVSAMTLFPGGKSANVDPVEKVAGWGRIGSPNEERGLFVTNLGRVVEVDLALRKVNSSRYLPGWPRPEEALGPVQIRGSGDPENYRIYAGSGVWLFARLVDVVSYPRLELVGSLDPEKEMSFTVAPKDGAALFWVGKELKRIALSGKEEKTISLPNRILDILSL